MRRAPEAPRTFRPLPKLTQRPDIQGIRALAVLLVVLSHAGVPLFSGGFVGVDVFFVVSGFLISSLLLREATTTSRVRISSFYARRARRILPAATLVLVATSVFAMLFLPLVRAQRVLSDVIWSAFFAANINFASQGTDYFQEGLPPSPVQHFWSLAVEEQFYLVWPALLALLLLLARRRRGEEGAPGAVLPAAAAVVVAVWFASLAWSVHSTATNPAGAYFSTSARAWELATGALLALSGHLLPRIPRAARHVLALAGLGAIALAAITYGPDTPFPGWQALLPVLGTAALIAAGAAGEAVGVSRVLTVRPVTWVGDISYSLYLWHWPALVLGALYVGKKQSVWETSVLVLAAVAAAAASYYWVENPFRRRDSRWWAGRRGIVLWPVAVSLTLGTALASGQYVDYEYTQIQRASKHFDISEVPVKERVRLTGGGIHDEIALAVDRARIDGPVPFPLKNDLQHLLGDIWKMPKECTAGTPESSVSLCPYGDTSSDRLIMVVGDSHANMWLPAVNKYATAHGYKMIPLIKWGCSPYDVTQTDHHDRIPATCEAFRRWAIDQVKRLHPDLLVVGSRGPTPWYVLPSGAARYDGWANAISSFLGKVEGGADKTVILGDASYLGRQPALCLSKRGANMGTCTVDQNPVTVKGNNAAARAARQAGVGFIDMDQFVCVDGQCPMVVNRIVTYHDRQHISQTWAEHVAPAFGRLLGRG